jgi:NitT/TauT family transport system ATP-binding protein
MTEVSLHSIGLRLGSYGVLSNLSFDIPRGQFVALVGPTGCGKSSVLNLVAGVLKPSSGLVRSGGRPLESINADAVYVTAGRHGSVLM